MSEDGGEKRLERKKSQNLQTFFFCARTVSLEQVFTYSRTNRRRGGRNEAVHGKLGADGSCKVKRVREEETEDERMARSVKRKDANSPPGLINLA